MFESYMPIDCTWQVLTNLRAHDWIWPSRYFNLSCACTFEHRNAPRVHSQGSFGLELAKQIFYRAHESVDTHISMHTCKHAHMYGHWAVHQLMLLHSDSVSTLSCLKSIFSPNAYTGTNPAPWSIYVYVCTYVCTNVCMYECVYMYACENVCMYTCMCMWQDMYVWMYVRMYEKDILPSRPPIACTYEW